jgi:tetratricopeptide (TPR) repeat protein
MWRPALVLAGVLTAYLALRLLVLQGHIFGVEAGPQVGYLRSEYRLLIALQAFPEYLRLLLMPLSLASDYAPAMFTPATGLTGTVLAGGVILAALLVLSLLAPLRPRLGFPAAWFLITILPVANLLFPTGVFVAERTLYLPSFALSAAVAFAAAALLPRAGPRATRVAAAALLLVTLLGGIRTWQRNRDWRSTDAIMNALARDHPESYVAQLRLASLAVERGASDAARQHYENAMAIYSDDSELLTEYGNFLLARGEAARALPVFERAYALHPFISRTAIFLGTAYLELNRFQDALELAAEARAQGFSTAVHAPLTAAALDGLGREEEALAAWQQVIDQAQLSPPALWALLARTLARRQAPDMALQAAGRGRLAAGSDMGTLQLMNAVEQAVRDSCYQRTADAQQQCDPVAAWMRALPTTYGAWVSPLDRPAANAEPEN